MLTAYERWTLDQIIAGADLIEVEGAPPHLLIEASPLLLEALAMIGAGEADLEPEEDEPDDDAEDWRQPPTLNAA